ncbi:MAG: hypothetical protein KDB44_09790 [Mycobacterium sp.]|nr:hypothetical protein [Mycobacterium sp.]
MTMPPLGGPSPSAQDRSLPNSSANRRRWMGLGLSLVVVIAVVIGLVVWKANHGPGAGTATPADDGVDRTVGLLREKDPVCDEWIVVSNKLASNEEKWAASNRGVPATAWSPEQRAIFSQVSEAMVMAADQYEAMLPKARDVVIQELIAQTIVYLRSYVERVPNYVESDGLIAGVAGNFGTAVTYMCSVVPLLPATNNGELRTRSLVPEPAALRPFLADGDPACTKFVELIDRQRSQLRGWAATDSTIPAAKWTPSQRALNNAAREVIMRDAAGVRAIAESAKSSIMADLLVTRAEYMQLFADRIPAYTQDDALLWTTVTSLGGGLTAACKAVL